MPKNDNECSFEFDSEDGDESSKKEERKESSFEMSKSIFFKGALEVLEGDLRITDQFGVIKGTLTQDENSRSFVRRNQTEVGFIQREEDDDFKYNVGDDWEVIHKTEPKSTIASSKVPVLMMRNTEGSICQTISSSASSKIIIPKKTRADQTKDAKHNK